MLWKTKTPSAVRSQHGDVPGKAHDLPVFQRGGICCLQLRINSALFCNLSLEEKLSRELVLSQYLLLLGALDTSDNPCSKWRESH